MSLANSHSDEGTLNGTLTITFPWPSRDVQITNDSSTNGLQFRLNQSEPYRTLKPRETCNLQDVRVPAIYLNTTASVNYRVWALG